MINRRQLRVKVLQALYEYFMQEENGQNISLSKINKRLDRIYDLYIYHFSFIIAISDFARKRIDDGQKKFIPTEDDLNPNLKFVNNPIIFKIREDLILQKNIERLKIKWSGDDQEMIRKVYQAFIQSDSYKSYMSQNAKFENEKAIIIDLIRDHMAENEVLHHHYEENNMFWNDDFFDALLLVQRSVKDFNEKDSQIASASLFKVEEQGGKEDVLFYRSLFQKCIKSSKMFDELIDKSASNWEFERIAFMDILLLKMALTEFIHFDQIPVKVSLNEYIELSKFYSTPRSKSFINGVLDKMVQELTEEGKILKKGRGLKK